MVKKIRLTRTMVVEYEPDPTNYPEGFTIQEIAEIDANSDDRELLFEECLTDEVVWQIIDEDIFNFELDEETKRKFPDSNFVYLAEKINDAYKISWEDRGRIETNYYKIPDVEGFLEKGLWIKVS